MKEVIATNSVQIKNFLIAFSSLALRMSLELVTSFRMAPRRHVGERQQPDRPGWLTRHPRIARAVLLGSQTILGMLLFVLAVNTLLLPSLVSDGADTPAPIGEIIGAEIVTALVIWAFIVLLLKARRWRKLVTALRPAIETAAPTT